MRRTDPGDRAALSRHWDGIASDEPFASTDPPRDLAATIDALHRLDRVPDPRPSFVDHLEKELMASEGFAQPSPSLGVLPMHLPIANGRRDDGQLLPQLARRRPRWRLAELAAVAVLLLALASGFAAYQLAPSANEEPPTFGAVLATGPAAASVTPSAIVRLPLAAVTIEARGDLTFMPSIVQIPADRDVAVSLRSTAPAGIPTTFTIDALNINVELDPGETKEITVNAPSGVYAFYSALPGQAEAGMVGTLIVTEGEPPPPPPVMDEVTVKLIDIEFEPDAFTVPANADVQVTLTNAGAARHDFTIEDLGIHEVLNPGEERTLTINVAPGTYDVICTQPGHKEAGMVGTLTVVDIGTPVP